MFFFKFEPPWEVPMAPRALRICILWPGGGALRAYDFVIVDECVWQSLLGAVSFCSCTLFFSWPAYCNFLLRLSSLLEVLSDINCAASFLDNCRQVSMADRSAWRQRSWTRNALAVVKIDRALA